VIRRALLLRHGRTIWNAQRRFQGQADPPLDDVGRAQSYEVSALVAALRPDAIVSSDLQRAVQTARPLGDVTGLAVKLEPRLRERSLGHWEGLTREEVAEQYPDEYADWLAGRDVSRRGGETREEVAERACEAFADLPAVEFVVLVTHSATALALSAALLDLPQRVHVLGPLANCHWSDLRYESGWRLRAHNAGPPGVVIPLPIPVEATLEDDAPDAQA
jgi:probable phosphoglycerate mutase